MFTKDPEKGTFRTTAQATEPGELQRYPTIPRDSNLLEDAIRKKANVSPVRGNCVRLSPRRDLLILV